MTDKPTDNTTPKATPKAKRRVRKTVRKQGSRRVTTQGMSQSEFTGSAMMDSTDKSQPDDAVDD